MGKANATPDNSPSGRAFALQYNGLAGLRRIAEIFATTMSPCRMQGGKHEKGVIAFI
jgi:hypothetical protein